MKTLDLTKTIVEFFSGSGILSDEFKLAGYKVYKIDNNKKLNPDLCINILDFEIKMLPEEFRNPTVVWASPPCNSFSVASISSHWINSKPKSYERQLHIVNTAKNIEKLRTFGLTLLNGYQEKNVIQVIVVMLKLEEV